MHPVEILDGAVTTQSEVYLLTPGESKYFYVYVTHINYNSNNFNI